MSTQFAARFARLFTAMLAAIVRTLQWWINDIQRRPSAVGKVASAGIGLLVLCCGLSVITTPFHVAPASQKVANVDQRSQVQQVSVQASSVTASATARPTEPPTATLAPTATASPTLPPTATATTVPTAVPPTVVPTARPQARPAARPTARPAPAPAAQPAAPATGQRIGAICRDGTRSNATGRGACSRHGGVARWLTR